MTPDKCQTRLACQITYINPDRFNEAVAAGLFPCAPKTRPGAARIFDVNDVITLRVYARLTVDDKMDAKVAGPLACGLRDLLHVHPDCDCAVHVLTGVGFATWVRREDLPHDAETFSGSDIVALHEYRFGWLRKRILHEIAEAARVVPD